MNLKKTIIAILTVLCFSNALSSVLISMSTDGKYVVSGGSDNHVYLYNTESKKVTKISDKNINLFSPNFINGTHNFIYQDTDNKVYVVNADTNKVIKSFQVPAVNIKGYEGRQNIFAQSMNKDLDTYAYVSVGGAINISELKDDKIVSNFRYGNRYLDAQGNVIPNFFKDKLITSTSDSRLLIFNLKAVSEAGNTTMNGGYEDGNNKYVNVVYKNSGPTMNAIDPNGKFVYTADSHTGIKYNLETGKVSNSAFYGTANITDVTSLKNNEKKVLTDHLGNFKFIDRDKIVVTFKGMSQPYLWAFFYTPSKLDWSKKDGIRPIFHTNEYTKLVDNPMDYITGNYTTGADAKPYPSTSGYNTTFDTSVEAHKLVMAQANGNGIMVYNYNPKDESLKLDWVGVPPKVEDKKEESNGWFW